MHHYQSILFALLALSGAGCTEVDVRQAPERHAAFPTQSADGGDASGKSKTDPQLITALVDVAQNKDRYRINLSQAEGTPVWDITKLGSPIGYSLRTRYLNVGVPLAEALSNSNDPAFRDQLITLARWDRDDEVRSAALIALASAAKDTAHADIFREALIHLKPSVRFGALEALVVWEHPEIAKPLLSAAAERDNEPLLRVYAAAGLARIGDPEGLDRLRKFLDDQSWLVRAMAGRYIGDLGQAPDYDLLVGRIGRETSNDFVVAEYCIAALKLFSKRS